MAAESWYSPMPGTPPYPPAAPPVPPAWNTGPVPVPPPPSSPPEVPLPEGFVRSHSDIELLLDQARAEYEMEWVEHHPDRMLTMWCSRPKEAANGIVECCRWVLGQRSTGPVSGRPCGHPLSRQELAKENFVARDIAERLIPEWRTVGDDYGAAVVKTLAWMRGSERPVALPGTRPR